MDTKKTSKMDKRIIKTRNKLMMGFAELLKQKSLSSIKVSELTDISGVNRATFYLHYKDIDDFVMQTEELLIKDFADLFKSSDMHINVSGEIPTIHNIIDFVSDNSVIMSALLSKNGDTSFSHRLAYVARCHVINEFLPEDSSSISDYYSVYYITNGMIGVIFKWIDGGFKESTDAMTSVLMGFITKGTQLITKN